MIEQAKQLFREGRIVEALAAARQAYDPTDPETALLLGVVCARAGQAAEGRARLEEALAAGLGQAAHWRILAALRAETGDPGGEAAALAEAVARAPDDPTYRLHLAAALLDAGEADKALDAAIAALRLQDSVEARRVFVAAVRPGRTDPEFRALLKRALSEWWARSGAVVQAAIELVKSEERPPEDDDLLSELLVTVPVRDATLERRLIAARRLLLLEGGAAAFVERLARQGEINEFCWAISPEEKQALATLPAGDRRRAMYEGEPYPTQNDIPRLTPIRGGVSEVVRSQYEANPYPRWVKLAQQAPEPQQRFLQAMFPRVRLEPIPGADILVAGCGTGQHALEVATRFAGSHVLAVDLSLTSLSYAKSKAEEYGISNIAFGQADLLELGSLGRSFAAVECAGTLQAMADPFEGFAVLAGLLRAGGVMKIALYSRTARAELAPAMALGRRYPHDLEGIRAFRQAVMDAPDGDPVRAALRWGDFYSASDCRDLLLHVQEHQSEIGDIKRMLEMSGFRFLGFSLPGPVLARYRAAYPDDPAATNLDNWAGFEDRHPDTFRQMYQFWMQKPA